MAIGDNALGLQPLLDAAVAQWLERNSYKVVVGGSIPPCRTLKINNDIHKMRMYIAVLDEFPDFMTPTLVAHSVLNAHLKFCDNPIYKKWLNESFKKCVVRVNSKEFEKIASLPNVHLGHENNTLNAKKSCAVVCPIEGEQPNVLKFAKLWKPLGEKNE